MLYLSQPVPPPEIFFKAVCKARNKISWVSFATFQWKETYKLWLRALLRALELENITANGIGWTLMSQRIKAQCLDAETLAIRG